MSHKKSFRRHASPRKTTTSSPFSLRLTEAERARLQALAGSQPLGSFIRARIFAGEAEVPRARGKGPVADHKALAQLLGKIGQSRLPENLNELAQATRVGALPLDGDTIAALQTACADIATMKRMLMTALGIRER
ncbi:MAG: hypothetical protein CMM50_16115 [Rhodospirillaceae bacterium]|nr:hypothetical protein [Rhodospirillaceae bacterium]